MKSSLLQSWDRLITVVANRLGIGGLFAAALVPGILAGSIHFYDIYRSERAQVEREALLTARALSQAVDKDLAGIRGKLETLAASASLQSVDLQNFYRRAGEIRSTEKLDGAIILTDETGQQVVNTLRPFGSELPKTAHPEQLQHTFETGRASVSDLYFSSAAGRHTVAQEVPVWRDGKVIYALDMAICTDRLNHLLGEVKLPAGWLAALLDSRGTVMARSQNADRYTGKSASPDLLVQVRLHDEGTLASQTMEGIPSFVAFSRSPSSGWTLAVAMDREVLYAHLYRPLASAGLTIVAFLLGGAMLAWAFTRHLRDALLKLEGTTNAVAAGDLDSLAPQVGPKEVAQLARQLNRMQQARKMVEERLRQSQQFSDDIINSLPGIFYMMDTEGRFVRWNNKFYEVTAYALDELGQMQALQLFDEDTSPLIRERVAEVFERGEAAVEAPLLTKDGRRIPYYFTGRRTSIGDQTYLVGLGIDISERKVAEAKLMEQETQFRQLSESLPQLVWTCTQDGQCDYLSPQWLAYTGIRTELQHGVGWQTCLHPGDRSATGVAWRSANAQRITFDVEYRLRRHDGVYRWFRTRAVPLLGEDGQIRKWFGTCTDIEDLKQIQEALLDSEQRYKALFNNKIHAVAHQRIITDEQGRPVDYRFESINEAYEHILSTTKEEIVGKLVTEAFPGIQDLEFDYIGVFGKIGLEGGEMSFETYFPLTGQWFSLYAYSPTVGECTAIFTDITAQKQAEAALLRLKTELEQRVAERTAEIVATNRELAAANRQLEGFLYAASHDLKGPLGRISSFSTLLEKRYRDRLEGDGLLFLNFIRDNSLRLNRLIDDLLTHARVDQQVCQRQPIDTQAAVQAALLDKAHDIHETGTVLRVDLPAAQVLADPYCLSQVLRNLLENALKYSIQIAEPVIEIGGEAMDGRFRLWVRDNGIGFDMEYHDKIFEIFRRLHTYVEYAGSGVGLALVKRAMDRMGGLVWAESEPGQGATFYLEFELASRPEDQKAALAELMSRHHSGCVSALVEESSR